MVATGHGTVIVRQIVPDGILLVRDVLVPVVGLAKHLSRPWRAFNGMRQLPALYAAVTAGILCLEAQPH
jgi:hypothetical protein